MEHVIVKLGNDKQEIESWLASSKDGELYDPDVLNHDSSFILTAVQTNSGNIAHLPVQQPLMLENFIKSPDLSTERSALALTRLVEYAIGEAYRRDVGEIYFLTRDSETANFAERHHFKTLPHGLQVYRLNLLETFGS